MIVAHLLKCARRAGSRRNVSGHAREKARNAATPVSSVTLNADQGRLPPSLRKDEFSVMAGVAAWGLAARRCSARGIDRSARWLTGQSGDRAPLARAPFGREPER